MRILSWNVRGAEQKDSKNQLRTVMKFHDSDILIFSETKIDLDRALSLISHLKIPHFQIICSEDFSGWIRLLWKDYVDFLLNIISTTNRFIQCRVHDNLKYVSWLATFIYCYPHQSLQKICGSKLLNFLLQMRSLGLF